jgi:hypothetical protein
LECFNVEHHSAKSFWRILMLSVILQCHFGVF